MFACLPDMGDPVGAAKHIRDVIAADGTWMIVEQAGFTRFRLAAQTPFNNIFEVRP